MKVNLIKVSNWTVTIILLTCFSSAIPKELEKIKFLFGPGENISFIQELTTIKEKDMGEKGKQLDESVSTTKITITKTESGWDVLSEPRSISMKRNGEEINNPIVSLLSSAVLTYKLDSDGTIINVEGYEPFIKGISEQIAPEVFKQLAPILNTEALESKEIVEWNGRIGDFAGVEVEIGDSFMADVPYQLPNGTTINYSVQTNIAALVPCGDNKCVRIEQFYDSQADNMAKMTGDVVSNLAEATGVEVNNPSSQENTATIQGNVIRIIDPKTMLVYEEESTRTITMEIAIPETEGLVPVKTSEIRKYEFEY